jgi:hypothetical protein
MQHTTVQALGQARLAELHHQAQRATLARAARQARRARRAQSGHRAPAVLAAAWARRSRRHLRVRDGARQPPGLAGRTSQRAPARQTATAGRRAALFAPGCSYRTSRPPPWPHKRSRPLCGGSASVAASAR